MNSKLKLLAIDAVCVPLYLLFIPAFYATKNICDLSNPIHCGSVFAGIFTIVILWNGYLNLPSGKLWQKLMVYAVPLGLILLN